MTNFLEETLDMLKDCGKTEDDVLWVGRCEDFTSGLPDVKNTWEWFKSKANFEYDNGYGGAEIPLSLVVVGVDFWLERHEYDGSEWWNIRECLLNHLKLKTLIYKGWIFMTNEIQ